MNNKVEILAQELVKDEYRQFGQDYEAIRDYLNQRPLIPNPVPQGNVPIILNLELLVSCISDPSEADAIAQRNLLDRIERIANENNHAGLRMFVVMFGHIFSDTTKKNIENLLAQEIPDPSWRSRIEGSGKADELKIYPVTEHEIQEALNPLTKLAGDPDAK